jgi:hypothetical protein
METIHKNKRTVLLDSYDLADGDLVIKSILLSHPRISLQAIWAGVVGGVVQIGFLQSSDGINYDAMQTVGDAGLESLILATVGLVGSNTVQDDEKFGGNYLGVVVGVGDVTAGTLTLILNTY